MALSTPPQPPEPSSTAAVTSTTSLAMTTTASRPLVPRPPNPHPFYSPPHSRLPSNPNPNYPQLAPRPPQPYPYSHLHPQDPSQFLYPIASTGRGFTSRPVAMPAIRPSPRPPFVFPYPDHSQGGPAFARPNQLQHMLLGSGPGSVTNTAGGVAAPLVVKGIPVSSSQLPKVGPPSSISDSNGHKDLRERKRDETFVVIKDRKVKISDDASLYSLCRSWLRNGFPEEVQPQYLDTVKSLPRPLPAAPFVDSPNKKEEDKAEEDEDDGSCEHLSAKELLQMHVKHAKRVRTRLREERLQRITRYKTRLALLLPPIVEQHFKNESAAN